MSKQINTHLFFHMSDSGGSKQKSLSGDGASSSSGRKPKKSSSSLFGGYEIDTNPPLPPESGDYYDYYTNYGIPDYYGPMSPPTSLAYNSQGTGGGVGVGGTTTRGGDGAYGDQYYYDQYRNTEYDYYNNLEVNSNYSNRDGYGNNGYDRSAQYKTNNTNSINYGESSSFYGNNEYLQPPLVSPPISDFKRSSPLPNRDLCSYRSEHQGLSSLANKLHRITFVEACLFQPPDLSSPVRFSGPPIHQSSSGPSAPIRPPAPVLAQGERSPTSTGGTQYYQEWTSKHMRHLCSRFEKPEQQNLLMNVERKSKYPFIILCKPDISSLSASPSCSSGKSPGPYRREFSQQSAYNFGEDEVEDEEESWITQKQRDSINSHYLPPPPPPLPMPHIWPEIRYIDGLYTVCASIVRPGSGVSCEFDELFYNDVTNLYDQSSSYDSRHEQNFYQNGPSMHRQDSSPFLRPTGYIVSAFATFPGEDSERLEKNWLFWTGARILYKYLPMCVGLRRLIFLKRCPDMYREDINMQSKIKPTIFTGFTYVLLCECFNLKESYIASVCTTIDQLRARCCGYSALYLTHFQQKLLTATSHQQQQQQHQQQQPQQYPKQSSQERFSSHASSSSSSSHHHHHPSHHHQHHHPQQQQQSHHIPRHHRSTDFTEFDNK